MPLEKLPVPEIQLETTDYGTDFQRKMNEALAALRTAIIAYNNQIDAALTAADFTQIASLADMESAESNALRVTPAGVKHAIEFFAPDTGNFGSAAYKNVGEPEGVASLDSAGLVPINQLTESDTAEAIIRQGPHESVMSFLLGGTAEHVNTFLMAGFDKQSWEALLLGGITEETRLVLQSGINQEIVEVLVSGFGGWNSSDPTTNSLVFDTLRAGFGNTDVRDVLVAGLGPGISDLLINGMDESVQFWRWLQPLNAIGGFLITGFCGVAGIAADISVSLPETGPESLSGFFTGAAPSSFALDSQLKCVVVSTGQNDDSLIIGGASGRFFATTSPGTDRESMTQDADWAEIITTKNSMKLGTTPASARAVLGLPKITYALTEPTPTDVALMSEYDEWVVYV